MSNNATTPTQECVIAVLSELGFSLTEIKKLGLDERLQYFIDKLSTEDLGLFTSISRMDAEKLSKMPVAKDGECSAGFRSNKLTDTEKEDLIQLLSEYGEAVNPDNSPNTVLQKDEVDRLLQGAAKKDEETSTDVNLRLPRLEIICDRFCRHITKEHSDTYRSRIEWNPISINQEKFGVLMRSLPVPTNITLLTANVFGQSPILSILDSRAVFALVESSMGTLASSQPLIEGREFTKIEQKVAIEKSQQVIVDCLNRAWSEAIADIEFKWLRDEINPQFAAIVLHDEDCVLVTYELEIDCCLGTAYQIIPRTAIKPYIRFLADVNSSIRLLTCSDEEFVELTEKRAAAAAAAVNRRNTATGYYLERFLRNTDPNSLAMVLRDEHPQTYACVASLMTPEQAAHFILALPAGIRSEVIKRLDTVEIRNRQFLHCIEDVLHELVLPDSIKTSPKGKAVLQVLSHLNPEASAEIKQDLP